MAGEITGVDEYQAMMGLKADGKKKKRKRKARSRALNRAHEIRMFEIRMLWQRALFVWGFQLAVFIAVAGLLGASCEGEQSCDPQGINLIFLCALSGLGLLLAYALVQINEGSKFWQANWEYHIDMLEDEFEGKLHKTHLKKVKDADKQIVSVSKVNKYISWFLFGFWLFIFGGFLIYALVPFCTSLYSWNIKSWHEMGLIIAGVVIISATGVGFYFLRFETVGSSERKQRILSKERITKFKGKE